MGCALCGPAWPGPCLRCEQPCHHTQTSAPWRAPPPPPPPPRPPLLLLQKTRLKRWGLPQDSALEGWAIYGLLGRPELRGAAPAAAMHAVLDAIKAAMFTLEGAYKPKRPAAPSPPADAPPVLEEAEEDEEPHEGGGRGGIAAATAALALNSMHTLARAGLTQAAVLLIPGEAQVGSHMLAAVCHVVLPRAAMLRCPACTAYRLLPLPLPPPPPQLLLPDDTAAVHLPIAAGDAGCGRPGGGDAAAGVPHCVHPPGGGPPRRRG